MNSLFEYSDSLRTPYESFLFRYSNSEFSDSSTLALFYGNYIYDRRHSHHEL